MAEGQPTVFVSSTCVDLAEVRSKVEHCIKRLGLTPFLSEHASFPAVSPGDTVETCCRNVQEYADIFVLIIGNRYGSVPKLEIGRSVTSMEYDHARAKAVPILPFVRKDVWKAYQAWKKDPSCVDCVVDSLKLFEFIKQLDEPGDLWINKYGNDEEEKGKKRNYESRVSR